MEKTSEKELNDWIEKHDLAILFFKSKNCGVCQAQLPILENITNELNLELKTIDLSENMHLSASQMVLNVPVTKVFFEGKEVLKEGAYIDFARIKKTLVQYQELH